MINSIMQHVGRKIVNSCRGRGPFFAEGSLVGLSGKTVAQVHIFRVFKLIVPDFSVFLGNRLLLLELDHLADMVGVFNLLFILLVKA